MNAFYISPADKEDIMKSFTTLKNYFSKTELILWSTSVVLILIAFCLFDRTSYMTLWTSLIGVTSLIFCAKGNPMGQLLMVLFSLLYGMIAGIGGLRGSSFFHVEQNVFRNIQRRIFFREGFIYGDCQKKEK